MNAVTPAGNPRADTLAAAGRLQFEPMRPDDLPVVVALENTVYSHPWTGGNFTDSLTNGHVAEVLRDADATLLGYMVIMPVLDEAHLLNISVRQSAQGRGFGLLLLQRVARLARQRDLKSLLLEVRLSNRRAIDLYRRFGFSEIGRRKNYYPLDAATREEAIVMQLMLADHDH